MTYKVYIKLYKIIVLETPWPLIMSQLCIKCWNEILRVKNLLLFENFLLSHKCWPRDVQHVEGVM